jgi:hypothetical protein
LIRCNSPHNWKGTEGLEAESAEAISGQATGALSFIGFGSLWLSTGLSLLHWFNCFSAEGVAIVAAALAIPAVRLLRHAGNYLRPTRAARRKPKLGAFSV